MPAPPFLAEAAPSKPNSSPAPIPGRSLALALAAVALAGAVLWVFHGALRFYFAQEDFRGLAIAKGLLPRHGMLWRYVSVQSFMDFFYPLLGDDPVKYHWVGIALHVTNALGLFALLARRLSAAAALVAAGFFATHPTLFTALYWLSARSDILVTCFSLLTVAFALRRDRWRWFSIPSFALALLSKESVILLPVAIWLIRRWCRGKERLEPRAAGSGGRDLLVPALAGLSAACGLYLLSGRAGVAFSTTTTSAYALDFNQAVARNFLTYVGWVADLVMRPAPLRFMDLQNPGVFWIAGVTVFLWSLGCLAPGLRARGWHVAGASFLFLLLPVLPLRNHTYHYFLYGPLAAAAWCLGAALDWGLEHERRAVSRGATTESVAGDLLRRVNPMAWLVTALCLVALTWNGGRLVKRMETGRMRVYPELRANPIVNRAMIAENVIAGLRRAQFPDRTNLAFVLRQRIAMLARIGLGSGEARPPNEATYVESNVRTALFDAYGVLALVPRVRSVTFSPDTLRATEPIRYVIYSPAGEVEMFSRDQLDSLLRSTWITQR